MKQSNNEAIKISVVVITRNRAKILSGCLKSLLRQTRLPDEVIVVDNASSDNTKKVILSFAKKLPIRYVLEKQVGMPYARNRGIKEATGTLILMLDDDCRADRFWVERMIHAHRKYPKAWVIQGRTFSFPETLFYSLFVEFRRFLYLNASVKKHPLKMKGFFSSGFRDEVELLVCNTQNLSIKISYLKKHKLSFDERFYRGADTDFSKQILQKKGLIMFCPQIKVHHWERSSLAEFLKQRWEFGRNTARVENKWKTPSFAKNTNIMMRLRIFLALLFFCRVLNQWHNLPALMALLFLESLYRLNGYFFEKMVLSLQSNNEAIEQPA